MRTKMKHIIEGLHTDETLSLNLHINVHFIFKIFTLFCNYHIIHVLSRRLLKTQINSFAKFDLNI